MKIPSWPQADEREAELLRMVLESPQWGGFHPYVAEFEKSFSAYQHARFGVSAANGTLTLELALAVLGVGPDDEVIVPAISFISTATAVSRVGAMPVFVDIEPWSFQMDPQRAREAITRRTKAILAVHFGGAMCRIDELQSICHEHGLVLLEDAAHAQGSEWRGQRAGSFGAAGSFSFQNGKVLCAGEGGMLVTSNEALAAKFRSLANQGRVPGRSFYEHEALGTNFRMTAFQAAVLLAQFERLDDQIAFRTANANALKHQLGDLAAIRWQEQGPEITRNSQYLILGRVASGRGARDDLCRALETAGAPCTPFYPHTLYQNPVFRREPCRVMPCPNAEACVTDAFWLPHRVLLADEQTIAELAGAIRRVLISNAVALLPR
jgi:dTDP-4-amino-4,6-dideoxygalactose transaminase